MENLDTVKKKLQKLRALYESAKKVNSEGEAAACAAAIQRILTQYNLTMEEVGVCGDDEKVDECRCSGMNYKMGGYWEFQLMNVIAEYNFCQCFMIGGTYKNLILFGRKENMETVKWLKDLLSERFVKFSNNRWNQYRFSEEQIFNPITKHRFQRAYLMGAVSGLREKLEEEKRRNEPDVATKITSLCLRRNAEIEDFVNLKYQRTKDVPMRNLAKNAERMGEEDGRKTQLYKPIATKQRSTASSVKMLN